MTTCSACARVSAVTAEIALRILRALELIARIVGTTLLITGTLIIAGAAWLSDAVSTWIKRHRD